MTSKEAIEVIKSNYPPEKYTILREALDFAIKLLEDDSKKEEWYKADECKLCEGLFEHNEKVIEVKGNRYCEACYEDLKRESNKD